MPMKIGLMECKREHPLFSLKGSHYCLRLEYCQFEAVSLEIPNGRASAFSLDMVLHLIRIINESLRSTEGGRSTGTENDWGAIM